MQNIFCIFSITILAIVYSSTPINRILTIYEYGKSAGQIPAYNATGYILTIRDRGGVPIKTINFSPQNGCTFFNGEIQWDGKDASGNNLRQGVYNFTLELFNCDHLLNGQKPTSYVKTSMQCIQYAPKTWWQNFWGLPADCAVYGPVNSVVGASNGVFSVTVLQ